MPWLHPTGRSTRVLAFVLAAATCASTTGCVRTVDPPPPPRASMPALEDMPPEPESGMARVIISTDVPARVEQVSGGTVSHGLRSRTIRLGQLLCESTPCAVTMPYGDHRLSFSAVQDGSRHGTTTVHVRKPTQVVNHKLGEYESSGGQSLGILAVVTGVVLFGVAGAIASSARKDHRPIPAHTRDIALAGLGSTIGGIVLIAAFPATYQPGSTTEWSPEQRGVAGRTIGGGLGLRF